MKIFIEDGKATEVFYNGKFYPTKTEIDLPVSEALRFSKTFRRPINEKSSPYDPSFFRDKKEVAMLAEIDTASGWGNVGLNLIKYSAHEVTTAQFGQLMHVRDREVLEAARRIIEPSMG